MTETPDTELKVVDLSTKREVPRTPPEVSQAIDALREMADESPIESVAVAFVDRDGNTFQGFFGISDNVRLLGALTLLQTRLSDAITQSAEEDDDE